MAAAVIVTVVRPRLFSRPHQTCDWWLSTALAAATVQLLHCPTSCAGCPPSADVIDETLRVDRAWRRWLNR
jgi:hypothetical protein